MIHFNEESIWETKSALFLTAAGGIINNLLRDPAGPEYAVGQRDEIIFIIKVNKKLDMQKIMMYTYIRVEVEQTTKGVPK